MKGVSNFILIILFLLLDPYEVFGEVKLPALISNGMVLQRDIPLTIWGWADPDEEVQIIFRDKSYATKADTHGKWSTELDASEAGGPYDMQINTITIHDILIGDVWLCGGQSNMELPLSRVTDLYATEIDRINISDIRIFRVPISYHFQEPQTRLPGGYWMKAVPAHIRSFSAVAYFFAAELQQRYHVPVGLVNIAVGGSPAEAWLSEENLKHYPEYAEMLKICSNPSYVDSVESSDRNRRNVWFKKLNANDPGVALWSEYGVDVSGWPSISLPGYWNDKGLDLINGSVWFQKNFDVPDKLSGREATLRLGRIIDSDSAFLNGVFVGSVGYQYPPRIYKVPSGVLKSGRNELMVRVVCPSGKGGFVVDKPYKILIDSLAVDLTGMWKYHPGAAMPPLNPQTFFRYKPAGLYNAMLFPVRDFEFKGVIWYQGESNTAKPDEYRQLFPDVIKDWRSTLNSSNLPFLYVQLANYGETSCCPTGSKWAELRDAQRRVLDLPKTGMAVTIDIGEWNDIHPLNKKEVGHRLALQANKVAYGDTGIISSGPLYEHMSVENNSIVLTFKSTGTGFNTNCRLQGFEIAGSDGQFVVAEADFVSQNSIKVWSNKIQHPQAVRYGWADNPASVNLYNLEGLPASPFTTAD
ncbi:sialate O-acetylesterase [Saccharicrinis sp. FJH62]|uniref:sialate O-acetylesterase n=1 Tax=Saccharicrinis sp. FJH62 TaxID=3344657 RepID=UPI0035D50D08